MNAPDAFVARLQSTFDGRLRIRYSHRDHNFHIEQKVGRAVVAPIFIEADRDDLIRARDGYHPVMTITPGDRMRCPECHYTLAVPVRATQDLRCPYCATMGRTTRVVVGFWPLDDSLINHLRKIDPLRGASDELAAEADRHNELLLAAQENDAVAPGHAAASDDYNRLVGIETNAYKHLPRHSSEKVAA